MRYLFLSFSWIISITIYAQCDTCNLPDPADHCYADSLFEGYCAGFSSGQTTFQLTSGKKVKRIPMEEQIDRQYFLELITNKKLKIKSRDLLFIQAALADWAIAKLTLGYTMDDQGLGIKILEEGTGTVPQKGENIKVHYTGSVISGMQF